MAEEKARDPTKPEIKPVSIPLSKIHDLPGSVFAPPSPKSLEALTSSIVLKGVQEPVILRQREDGEFQIVSGNRRRKASELAKKTEIPAFIYDMTEKEARDFRLRGNAKGTPPGKLLPENEIGQAGVNELRRYGVDTTKIVRGGNRVGIYFNEKGASQRGSVCIYDRAHSAIQEAQPSDFDWDAIFEGAEWFHFTGITPALGENVVEICRQACKAAKAHGCKISCDLNYRGKLWTRDQARAAMTDLCQYVDVCISNEEDAKDVFGIEAEATDIYGGSLNHEGYKSVAKQLADKFGFEMVAITLRESHSAFDNGWSAMLYNVAKDEYCFSKKYDLHIIDRVGGGDSFGGGLIYSLMNGKDTQAAVEFAVAASALKHSIEGDYNMVTVPEVEKLAGGDGSGRIQR